MPLEIVVVGAGIGGLCAAVGLHQTGHSVKVFEKSLFANEVGSAVLITPNGVRVLAKLGFDFAKARADEMTYSEVLDGTTLASLNSTAGDLLDPRDEFGTPLYTIHRSDLVNELLRLAKGMDVRLGTKVAGVTEDEGAVVLENGSIFPADLILAGDGLHSILRPVVLRDQAIAAAVPSGMSAFRFMIPTALLAEDPIFQKLQREVKGKSSCLFADTTKVDTEHHMAWFTCRDEQIQVFVGIHESERTTGQDLKSLMLSEFSHYHDDLKHIIRMAPQVTDWPLDIHDPLEVWHRGKIALIGDSAHPMLPLGAQGANQAIEDAGAVSMLLNINIKAEDIPEQLVLLEQVRRLRASRVQILSNVRLGRERDVEAQLRQYADPPGSDVPLSFAERYKHDYGFDVFAKCEEVQTLA